MCVLYVSFGSKVRLRTFGYVAMRSVALFIFSSRLLLYSAWFGVNRVQVVLSGFSVRLFCLDLVSDCFVFARQKLYLGMVVCISWLHSCLCV